MDAQTLVVLVGSGRPAVEWRGHTIERTGGRAPWLVTGPGATRHRFASATLACAYVLQQVAACS